MLSPFGALLHPSGEDVDLLLAQRFVPVGHAILRICKAQPAYHLAGARIAGHDGLFSRRRLCKGILPEQEAESTFRPYPAMTGNALSIDNGFYFRAEIDGRFMRTENDEPNDGYQAQDDPEKSSSNEGNTHMAFILPKIRNFPRITARTGFYRKPARSTFVV
jgi:hypothetical protein